MTISASCTTENRNRPQPMGSKGFSFQAPPGHRTPQTGTPTTPQGSHERLVPGHLHGEAGARARDDRGCNTRAGTSHSCQVEAAEVSVEQTGHVRISRAAGVHWRVCCPVWRHHLRKRALA